MTKFRDKVLLVALITIVLNKYEFSSAESITTNGSYVMKIIKSAKNVTKVAPRHLAEGKDSISNKIADAENKIVDLKKGSSERVNKSQKSFSNFPHNLQIVLEVLQKLENHECARDTAIILETITNEERWTLEMFDSFPKFPTGILYGNYYQLGNFDECIGAVQPETDSLSEPIKGQYCLADIQLQFSKPPSNFTKHVDRHKYSQKRIHWGVCIPSSCKAKDAEIFVKEIFISVVNNFKIVSVDVAEQNCYVQKSEPFTKYEIIYGCVIGCLLILSVLATSFHVWYLRNRQKTVVYNVDGARTKEQNLLKDIVICFSALHNVEKFLSVRPTELNLECFGGIKFLSMVFIIGGHTLMFSFGGPHENSNFFIREAVKVENGVFTNSPLLVDTFLLVSGFLMCRLFLIELEKRKGKINILVLYIARYIRLTPSYAVIIFFYMTFFVRMGNGPLWASKVGLEQERCLKSWWTNLLYVNNYVNTDYLCMFQSWYLAVDYHLFIIAPFLIYPLYKKRRVGELLIFLTTVVTIVTPFWLTYKYSYDPTFLTYPPELYDVSSNFYFLNIYIKTHMRASSYFLGLIFGYLVHRMQSSGTKLSPVVNALGWFGATICGVVSMASVVVFYDPNHEYNNLEAAIYAGLHRVAWSSSIGWIILVTVTDNANIINRVLSWKAFLPLSRLTYSAYLVNGIVEVYTIGVIRQPAYFSTYEFSCKMISHVFLTFGLAFILCIFFESPIHGLEKILLSREKKQNEAKQTALPNSG